MAYARLTLHTIGIFGKVFCSVWNVKQIEHTRRNAGLLTQSENMSEIYKCIIYDFESRVAIYVHYIVYANVLIMRESTVYFTEIQNINYSF